MEIRFFVACSQGIIKNEYTSCFICTLHQVIFHKCLQIPATTFAMLHVVYVAQLRERNAAPSKSPGDYRVPGLFNPVERVPRGLAVAAVSWFSFGLRYIVRETGSGDGSDAD